MILGNVKIFYVARKSFSLVVESLKENKKQENAILDTKCQHWKKTYSGEPEFLGEEHSYPAQKAAEIFKKEGKTKILELGGGQGRDSLYFAQEGFQITVLDYCESGIKSIRQKADTLNLSQSVTTKCHDLREPFPFDDVSFDVCFSPMLYCMAITPSELEFLSQEVKRVIKPNGLNIYTVRNTSDKHYRTGIHRGEDMYEVNGFIVPFFSREKVEHLAKGYEIVCIEQFEEGELPRKLLLVELRKPH